MDMPSLSRCRFLAAAGVTLGVPTLAVSGLLPLGADELAIDLPELTLGETAMSQNPWLHM